ncbi:Chitin binding domain [Trinorchestia longiramus]|nr:Chitin binding domain [Trinorchestia longiramus]
MRAFGITLVCVAVLGFGSVQGQSAGGQPDPCTLKARVVGDETYCNRYWECINGQAQLFDCPNGLVFVGRNRGIAEGCDYPWRGNYCFNKQVANAPISTEHCEWLYGIFGHETSCTRYWTCWNGTATEQFCIGGLLYNEETHACDWPQNVVGCQKHPLCKDDPNANVQLGKSCERYWACQGGYPRLQRCPATLVFDRVSRRCIAPPTADCDVPSTTPRPESQARQGLQGQNVRASQIQEFQAEGGRPNQGQQPVQIRRPQPVRRPVSQRAQFQPQEQELPPQEQFVGEEQANFEPAQQDQEVAPLPPQDEQRPPARPLRPARPQFSSGPQLPFIPSGATPIQFNSGSGPRLPPIPGAIPVRLN